jgi:hypothetical protein
MNLDEHLDAFEIQDFTVASAWERLIVSIESVFRKWASNVETNKNNANNTVLVETVEYSRKTLFVRFHNNSNNASASLLEMCDSRNDFSWNSHPLSRYFGFSSFVTVESDAIATELDEARLLLSSLVVALDSVPSLVVPVFVSYGREHPRDYLGYMRTGESVVDFSAKAQNTKKKQNKTNKQKK